MVSILVRNDNPNKIYFAENLCMWPLFNRNDCVTQKQSLLALFFLYLQKKKSVWHDFNQNN